jgi:CheY-like chemotaxis protein
LVATSERFTPDLRTLEANDKSRQLRGRKVLVVEDECLVAEDFAAILREAGAEVIGPAESLPQAIRLAQNGALPDAALLDIDLDGTAVFPLAEQLRAEGVPMLFLTGMGCDDVPDEFADVLCIAKPIIAARVVDELAALMGPVTAAA